MRSCSPYIRLPSCICFSSLRQAMRFPRSLALARAGSNMAARIAMIAITTNSSIKVNAQNFFLELVNTHMRFDGLRRARFLREYTVGLASAQNYQYALAFTNTTI